MISSCIYKMGKPQARKGTPAKNKRVHRVRKTKHFTKQPDQIWEQLQQGSAPVPLNEDLPGLGQFYCAHCARDFVSALGLETHSRTKDHKRQVKKVSEKPFDLKEAALLNK